MKTFADFLHLAHENPAEVERLMRMGLEHHMPDVFIKTKGSHIILRTSRKRRDKYGRYAEHLQINDDWNITRLVYFGKDDIECHVATVQNQVALFRELQRLEYI